jgi:hypothetical protein
LASKNREVKKLFGVVVLSLGLVGGGAISAAQAQPLEGRTVPKPIRDQRGIVQKGESARPPRLLEEESEDMKAIISDHYADLQRRGMVPEPLTFKDLDLDVAFDQLMEEFPWERLSAPLAVEATDDIEEANVTIHVPKDLRLRAVRPSEVIPDPRSLVWFFEETKESETGLNQEELETAIGYFKDKGLINQDQKEVIYKIADYKIAEDDYWIDRPR